MRKIKVEIVVEIPIGNYSGDDTEASKQILDEIEVGLAIVGLKVDVSAKEILK